MGKKCEGSSMALNRSEQAAVTKRGGCLEALAAVIAQAEQNASTNQALIKSRRKVREEALNKRWERMMGLRDQARTEMIVEQMSNIEKADDTGPLFASIQQTETVGVNETTENVPNENLANLPAGEAQNMMTSVVTDTSAAAMTLENIKIL